MWTIYHNPDCSKSNAALELLESRGIHPNVIHYLETPLSVTELRALLEKLSFDIESMIRKKESLFLAHENDWNHFSIDQKIQFLHENIGLLERPIVVRGAFAKLGRPTADAILSLFDEEGC